MDEQSPIRNPLLPIVLLIGVIFGLIFVAFRATGTLPSFEPIPTSPTATLPPTQSLTETPQLSDTPTPQPTWTLRPTSTPTHTPTLTNTPTATLFPSLTPARPLEINDLYRLREWTVERAEQLVSLLRDYPEARFRTNQDRQNPQFNEAYAYPAFAYREALLRFPDAPTATSWKWELAYSLARSNAPLVGSFYSDMILEALESGETRVDRLPKWFSAREQRLVLQVYPVPAQTGDQQSHIVQIEGGGSAYIWILERSGGFTAHILASHFDFASDIQSGLVIEDFTGDGHAEAVISFSQTPENTILTPPLVFSMASMPPVQLPFAPSIPLDLGTGFNGTWNPGSENNREDLLEFNARLLSACPVDITRSYRWNGVAFEQVSTDYNLEPEPSIVEYCEITVEHAARLWGHEISAEFMEAVLPYWPPERRVDGRLYRPEARDEWIYRLGISHALAGNLEQARGFLQEIVDSPSQSESPWIQPSSDFLEAYRSEDDLYLACTQSLDCDARAALRDITARIPVERYAQAHIDLRAYGVVLRSSGLFDFNRDGVPERWFVVRHRENQKLELWILARDTEMIHALYISDIESASPTFRYSDQEGEPPIVQLQLGEGFKLEHLPEIGTPFISYHTVEFVPTTFTRDTLEGAIEDLFSGQDPAGVLTTLENLEQSERFNCLNFSICDRFYYMLGLAYELNGREREAIDTYVKLWWENRESPFTTMARLKLEQITRTTPVPTPRTSTPGAYPSPETTPTGAYPPPEASPSPSPYPSP
jgi:hypothetical protein